MTYFRVRIWNENRVLALVLAAAALAAGSCATKHCGGRAITCADHANECASLAGCKMSPGCQYKFGAVDGICRPATNQPSCEAVTASNCAWTANRCESVCGTISDPDMCASFDPGKTFPCTWSDCSGVPDRPFCDDYPVDQCPSRLGCEVTESDPVGT